MNAAKVLGLLGVVLVLSACVSPGSGKTVVPFGNEPTNRQATAAITEYIDQTLKDRDSVSQLRIRAGPVPISWYRGLVAGGGHENAWLVCFQYSTKVRDDANAGPTSDRLALRMSGDRAYVVSSVNWAVSDAQC